MDRTRGIRSVDDRLIDRKKDRSHIDDEEGGGGRGGEGGGRADMQGYMRVMRVSMRMLSPIAEEEGVCVCGGGGGRGKGI